MNSDKEIDALVRDNIKLVFFCYERMPKNTTTIRYRDDLISEGYYGLFKAARTYDADKSKFATYATRCIFNEMKMFLRKAYRWACEISLETEIGNEEGETVRLMDIIPDKKDYIAESLAEENIIRFIGQCKERDRQILILRESGMSMSQIGKALGYSQSYVSRMMNAIRKRYHSENDEERYGNKKN